MKKLELSFKVCVNSLVKLMPIVMSHLATDFAGQNLLKCRVQNYFDINVIS